MGYVADIGLEIHVQLKTRSKMFCGCGTEFGAAPNTQVCPVCLGYPGVLPVMNEEALRLTVLTGLMVGSEIPGRSKFDRKSYFYPDMPKNYQISQYDEPLCVGGAVDLEAEGVTKKVRLTRIHLEEDVGKSIHFRARSGVDFNRAGVPLMEIVTEPDLGTPEEAHLFLCALKQILLYAGVSDCNLEQGNMRCDVNCSVRQEGASGLGTKSEIKNLNTFKGVLNALKYEFERQVRLLESGGTVRQDTRRWDDETGMTIEMRSKEYAHDYRYFPEPDLMPVVLERKAVADLERSLPELPDRRRRRLVEQYGLPEYDAKVLVAEKTVADFFETAARVSSNPKGVSNWIMTEMLRLLSETGKSLAEVPMTPESLAALVKLSDEGRMNSTAAKAIFCLMFEKGGAPDVILKERGLEQVSDLGALEQLVDRVIAENGQSADAYKAGKKAALKFLMGQAMRLSKGKANPRLVTDMLESKLAAERSS